MTLLAMGPRSTAASYEKRTVFVSVIVFEVVPIMDKENPLPVPIPLQYANKSPPFFIPFYY